MTPSYRLPHRRTLLVRVSACLGRRVVSTAYLPDSGPEIIDAYLVSIVPQGQEPILRDHGYDRLAEVLRETPLEDIRLRFYIPARMCPDGKPEWLTLPMSRLVGLRSVKWGWQRALDEIEQRVANATKKGPVTVITGVVSGA